MLSVLKMGNYTTFYKPERERPLGRPKLIKTILKRLLNEYVGFEILTLVCTMKFWVLVLYGLVGTCQHFGKSHCLLLQD
jgi:hypothetical protein